MLEQTYLEKGIHLHNIIRPPNATTQPLHTHEPYFPIEIFLLCHLNLSPAIFEMHNKNIKKKRVEKNEYENYTTKTRRAKEMGKNRKTLFLIINLSLANQFTFLCIYAFSVLHICIHISQRMH